MIGEAEETEQAAARWILRQEEDAWSQADRDALEAWLNADPQHRVAYYRLEYGWRRADLIADLADPALSVSAEDPITG
jgi:transmembrane sensor